MSFTAYPLLEKQLARHVREAALDHEGLNMPLRICELSQCRATCCHDGVFLDAEQVRAIESLHDRIDKYGIHRSQMFDQRDGRQKSATISAQTDQLADDFPEHFPKTRCVFLDSQNRCVLQVLAVEDALHPWWWKPVSCWMHPLLFRYQDDGRPILTLEKATEKGGEGFGSCTPCGKASPGGDPAWMTLRGELELLGKIGGRDLLSELA